MSARRSGFGIVLGLAVFFVLIFSIGGASLSGLGSRVKGDVRTGQEVARAHAMARAAAEELAFLVQTASASDSTPVGLMLRDTAVRLPPAGLPLPVPSGSDGPPVFAKLVAPAYPELKLVAASAKLVDIRAFRTTLLPWHGDHYGTVAIESRVATRRGNTEVVAERWLEFKVFHAGPTPPFDLTTLAMVDPWGWCNGHARYTEKTNDENTNHLIAEILTDVREAGAQIADLKKRVKKIEGVAPDAAAEVRTGVREAEQLLAASRELITWWEGSSPEPDHKYMRTPHLRYVISKNIDGHEVNLPAILAPQTPVRLKEYKETERLRKELEKDISSEAEAMRILRPLRRSSLALLKVDMQILTDIRRVQEMFVRRVGPTQMELFSRHLAILREGHEDRTSAPGGTVAFAAGRVTHRVRGPANAGLAKLLETCGRPFTGIVDVDNAGEPLTLPGPLAGFEGRIALVARGDVTINGLKVSRAGGRRSGMVTVICQGRLSAQGEVEASLVALDRFVAPGSLTITGNLFLDGYRGQVFRDGAAEDVLKNVTIVEDQRLRALDPENVGGAPRPESYRVVFGPRPIRDVVRRVAAEARP